MYENLNYIVNINDRTSSDKPVTYRPLTITNSVSAGHKFKENTIYNSYIKNTIHSSRIDSYPAFNNIVNKIEQNTGFQNSCMDNLNKVFNSKSFNISDNLNYNYGLNKTSQIYNEKLPGKLPYNYNVTNSRNSLTMTDLKANINLLKLKLETINKLAGNIILDKSNRKYDNNSIRLANLKNDFRKVNYIHEEGNLNFKENLVEEHVNLSENPKENKKNFNKKQVQFSIIERNTLGLSSECSKYSKILENKKKSSNLLRKSSSSDVDLEDLTERILNLRNENDFKSNENEKEIYVEMLESKDSHNSSMEDMNYMTNRLRNSLPLVSSKNSFFSFKHLFENVKIVPKPNEEQLLLEKDSKTNYLLNIDNHLNDLAGIRRRNSSIVGSTANMIDLSKEVSIKPPPRKKEGKHMKKLSLSSIELKQLTEKITLFIQANPDNVYQFFDNVNIDVDITNDLNNNIKFDLSSLLNSKTSDNQLNISNFNFEDVYCEENDYEIFKKIGLQKLNYLIEESEKDEQPNQFIEIRTLSKSMEKKGKLINEVKPKFNNSSRNNCNSKPKKEKRSAINLCKKFKNNPSKFFTETPSSEVLLKTLNLTSTFMSSKNFSPINKNEKHDFLSIKNSPPLPYFKHGKNSEERVLEDINISEIKEGSPSKLRVSNTSLSSDFIPLLDGTKTKKSFKLELKRLKN